MGLAPVLAMALAALVAVPSVVGGVLEVRRALQVANEAARVDRQLVGAAIAADAVAFVAAPMQATEALAGMAASIGITSGAARATFEPVIAAQRRYFPSAYTCFVADSTGVVIAADPPVGKLGRTVIGTSYADREYFAVVKRTLRPYVSGSLLSRSSSEPAVAVIAPILAAAGGDAPPRFDGIAGCAVSTAALRERALRIAEGSNLDVYAIDRDGALIIHPDVARHGDATTLALLQRATARTERAGPDEAGRASLSTSFPLEALDLGWTVTVVGDQSTVAAAGRDAALEALFLMLVSFAIAVTLGVWFARWFTRPITALVDVAEAFGDGDLRRTPPPPRPRETLEVTRLLLAVQGMIERLRQNVGSVAGAAEGIDDVIRDIRGAASRAGEQAASAHDGTRASVQAIDDIGQSLSLLGKDVGDASAAAARSLLAVAAFEEDGASVRARVDDVDHAVALTASESEAVRHSAADVARAAEDVAAHAHETAAAIADIDQVVATVERAAVEAARLAGAAAHEAKAGVEAVRTTIQGVDAMQQSSEAASAAVRTLATHVREISSVVTVIDDVTERTKLLALNASILAAQAGDSGFSVVADEIRRLAEQTGASTQKIGQMVQGARAATEVALLAVLKGEQTVAQGVRGAAQAETALTGIIASTQRGTEAALSIAGLTERQSQRARAATSAVRAVSARTQQIALAATTQAAAASKMAEEAQGARDIAAGAREAVSSQTARLALIREALSQTSATVAAVESTHARQAKAAAHVRGGARLVDALIDEQARALLDLDLALQALRAHGDELRRELSRFRVHVATPAHPADGS